jgi:hypothetical protein
VRPSDHALAEANARMSAVRAPVSRRVVQQAAKSAYGYVCRLAGIANARP